MNVQRFHEIAVNLSVRRRQAAFSRGRLVGVCILAPEFFSPPSLPRLDVGGSCL